jgi:hypothetical protein
MFSLTGPEAQRLRYETILVMWWRRLQTSLRSGPVPASTAVSERQRSPVV